MALFQADDNLANNLDLSVASNEDISSPSSFGIIFMDEFFNFQVDLAGANINVFASSADGSLVASVASGQLQLFSSGGGEGGDLLGPNGIYIVPFYGIAAATYNTVPSSKQLLWT
eukprot:680362_1